MVDHFLLLGALRARLKELEVATTGTTTLGSSADGYTRSAGSFITDGFRVGMEVTPSGFVSNDTPGIITEVFALLMEIEGGLTVEAEAPGRSLVVGLPEKRAWENMAFTPKDGRWYIEEDYIPGPSSGVAFKELQVDPTYVLRLYGISDRGVGALYKVAGEILALFAPHSTMLASDGHILRVKGDPAPDFGKALPEGASHVMTVINVPLWVRTANIV